MNAIIAVIGQDKMGILAKISAVCAENNANIEDVTQRVMQKYFTMIMLTDISDLSCDFEVFSKKVQDTGNDMGMTVHVMHEDIFNSMHRI